MLRSHPGIVEPRRDGVHGRYLPVLVLAEIGLHAVEYAEATGVDGRRGLERVYALAGGLAAHQLHLLVLDEIVERPDGVAASADAGDEHVRDPALLLDGLLPDLLAYHGLEVPDDRRERVRAHDGSQAVVGVVYARGPLAHALRHRVLEGAGPGLDTADLRPHEPHAVNVERLALHVLHAHVHDALEPHEGRRCRCCDTVLPRSGLGDEAGLAHLLREQRLPEDVVDLMGAGVVEVLPLEVDLRASEVLGHPLRVVQAAGAARVVVQEGLELPLELRVVLVAVVGLLQLYDRVHQRLGDVLPPVRSEPSIRVCHILTSSASWDLTALTNARIRSLSLIPSTSVPELVSTA